MKNNEDWKLIESLAGLKPGYRLCSYLHVGIPYFRVRLECLVLKSKSINTIDEFLLRSISAGLRRPNELSSFLGLKESYINDALSSLLIDDELVYTNGLLDVSPKGQNTLKELKRDSPENFWLSVLYDGLLKQCVHKTYEELRSPAQAKLDTLHQIPSTSSKPPGLGEFSIKILDSYINEVLPKERRPDVTVLAIKEVKDPQLLYKPGLLLAFRSKLDEVQLELAVDGRFSDNETKVFNENSSDFKRRIESDLMLGPSYSDLLALLPHRVAQRFPSSEDSETHERALSEMTRELLHLERRNALLRPDTESNESQELKDCISRRRLAKNEREKNGIWRLGPHEQDYEVRRGMRKCRSRVLIAVNHLPKAGIGRELQNLLHRALKKGVSVTLTLPNHVASGPLADPLEEFLKTRTLDIKTKPRIDVNVFAYDNQLAILSSVPWFGKTSQLCFDFKCLALTDEPTINSFFLSGGRTGKGKN